MSKRALILAILIIVLGLIGLGWQYFQGKKTDDTIEASGTIDTTEIQVGSRIGGRIIAMLAREGDNVKANQPLIKLDPYQIPAQKAALKAQLRQAQAQLLESIHGPRPQEIAQARAQYQASQAQANLSRIGPRTEDIAQAQATLRQAQSNLQNDEANYQRFQQLYQRHVVSQQEFDNTRTTYQSSLQEVNIARQKLLELQRGNRPQEVEQAAQQARAQQEQWRLLLAGTRPEQIAQQRAQVQNIQAQIAELDKSAAESIIKSSCNCQINTMNWRVGQLVTSNQSVASLYNLDDLWVRVYIPEERFGLMHIGDRVQVKVDAYPDAIFQGKVVQLASRAEFTPRNVQTEEGRKIQVFGVKVALDNRKRLLRPGMPADVTFNIDKRATIHGRA